MVNFQDKQRFISSVIILEEEPPLGEIQGFFNLAFMANELG